MKLRTTMHHDPQQPHQEFTSASELAEMGVCEQRVLLAARLGTRRSGRQQASADLGTERHHAFHRAAILGQPRVSTSEPADKRCFIATAVFGESPQTVTLRRFRDRVLLPRPTGRQLIRIYYRWSPALASFIGVSARRKRFAAAVLAPLVWLAGGLVNRYLRDDKEKAQ